MSVPIVGLHQREMLEFAEQTKTPARNHSGFVPALVLRFPCCGQAVGWSNADLLILICASGRLVRSLAFRHDNPPPGSPSLASHARASAHRACHLASDPGGRPGAQSRSWPAQSSAPALPPLLLRRWHERTTPAIPLRSAPRCTAQSVSAAPDPADVKYARPLLHKGPKLSPTAAAFPTAIVRRGNLASTPSENLRRANAMHRREPRPESDAWSVPAR